MKELQYTQIVHGEIITEDSRRNKVAQNYINSVDKKYKLQRAIFMVVYGISMVMILILIVATLGR